jgi:enoyl-CoA hydratase/carnithine racemase
MNLERISIEARGHVLLIGLDRTAKRNAFDLQMYAELGQALGSLQRDEQLRCGLLFAHGEHFTGGIELPQWLPFFRDGRMPPLPEGALDPLAREPERTLAKPLVIAVHGWNPHVGSSTEYTDDKAIGISSDAVAVAVHSVTPGPT